MANDFDRLNEVFSSQDKKPQEVNPPAGRKSNRGKMAKKVNSVMTEDKDKDLRNYSGDGDSERDYHPIRQNHEYRSGCLGGMLYFLFIMCVSVILACLAWMAASDMLALNKDSFTAVVSLPVDIFETETVDKLDEEGKVVGTSRVTHADMDYVAQSLKDAGLIEYKWLFNAFCKLSHADEKVDPGDYELQSRFDYRALIKNMQAGSGSTVTKTITIPEGYTMHQIFLLLDENGVSGYDSLMEAAANYDYNYSFLENLPLGDATRLEGFLFPDTYEFYVGMQASGAINRLLENFHSKITADMVNQMNQRGLDIRTVVNVASLIEKEAANDGERGTISSVIYNRSAMGMTLGIDASILYIYPDHEGGPTGEMLADPSPYNTRINVGLPPTPIANPGIASINAALNPETTDYYYYALDTATGEHRFFTNSMEFDAFVATQNYD